MLRLIPLAVLVVGCLRDHEILERHNGDRGELCFALATGGAPASLQVGTHEIVVDRRVTHFENCQTGRCDSIETVTESLDTDTVAAFDSASVVIDQARLLEGALHLTIRATEPTRSTLRVAGNHSDSFTIEFVELQLVPGLSRAPAVPR